MVNQRKAAAAEMTIGELCQAFDKGHLPNVKPKTAREYRNAIRLWIKPKLGKIRVADLKRSDITAWLEKGRGKHDRPPEDCGVRAHMRHGAPRIGNAQAKTVMASGSVEMPLVSVRLVRDAMMETATDARTRTRS